MAEFLLAAGILSGVFIAMKGVYQVGYQQGRAEALNEAIQMMEDQWQQQ